MSVYYRFAVVCLTITTSFANGDYDYRDEIKLTKLPVRSWKASSKIPSATYHDVMRHAAAPGGTVWRHLESGDPHSDAHETMHAFPPNYGSSTKHIAFYYLENGSGVKMPMPPGLKKDVTPSIPAKIREITSFRESDKSPLKESSSKYLIYFSPYEKGTGGTRAWTNHVFEEWICYITEVRVAIELLKAGYKFTYPIDVTSDGSSSFLYYATAAAYAISKDYPNYFKDNTQFKAIFAALAEKSMQNYWDGENLKGLRTRRVSQYLLHHLLHNRDTEHLRKFLETWFDTEWVNRVLRPGDIEKVL